MQFPNSVKAILSSCVLAGFLLSSNSAYSATVDDGLSTTSKTNKAGKQSQRKIDKLSRETQDLLNQYKKLLHNTEYQDAYSDQLKQLKEEQELQLEALEQQLNDIKITQQRIMPLMHGMADTLQEFILLDLPFNQEQRLSSVTALKQQLKSATLSTPAKFRAVWEAYQIENDYGRTIDSWRGPVKIDGEEFSVEFLRVGRIALFYQTLDGEQNAYWDTQTRKWQPLSEDYSNAIKRGVRVASNQLAPQLLELPLSSTGGQ